MQERTKRFDTLAAIMTANKEKYAQTIVNEMGKPIAQARGEIDKSILHLRYYQEHAAEFLKDERVNMMSGHTGTIKI